MSFFMGRISLSLIIKICSITSFLFISSANAQLKKQLDHLIREDSAVISNTPRTTSDSLSDTLYTDSLRYYRLREANLMMELEQLRSQNRHSDSIRTRHLQHQIDSLRRFTKGIPVMIGQDTLFTLYANRGGNTPAARAAQAEKVIFGLRKELTLRPDSVYIDSTDIETDIMYKGNVIISVTDEDALWADMPRSELARKWRKDIVTELIVLKKEYGLRSLLRRIGLLLLTLALQVGFIILCRKGYCFLKKRILTIDEKKFKPIRIKDYELLSTAQEARGLVGAVSLVRYLFILISLLISVPVIFSIFPATEKTAHDIFHYLSGPLHKVGKDIVDYLPNLLIIFAIWLVIHYLVKGFRYIAEEIASGKLKLKGFYTDWARPSFDIIRLVLYAFMIGMMYPYLPGAHSKIFQGISVFAGLLVSFGSASAISNIMAGLAIIYMRPFKIGDRIKINDVMGDVIEKTTLVTRVRTPKNEIVTIPNSFILSKHVTNFSNSANQFGLIMFSTVTIGYDVPWRQVNKLLIEAALATDGIQKDPQPFVLELSLDDNYPVYQINAYIKDADKEAHIKSAMLQNIQDYFDKAGVEILSPSYIATRNGNESTIPKTTGEN